MNSVQERSTARMKKIRNYIWPIITEGGFLIAGEPLDEQPHIITEEGKLYYSVILEPNSPIEKPLLYGIIFLITQKFDVFTLENEIEKLRNKDIKNITAIIYADEINFFKYSFAKRNHRKKLLIKLSQYYNSSQRENMLLLSGTEKTIYESPIGKMTLNDTPWNQLIYYHPKREEDRDGEDLEGILKIYQLSNVNPSKAIVFEKNLRNELINDVHIVAEKTIKEPIILVGNNFLTKEEYDKEVYSGILKLNPKLFPSLNNGTLFG